MIDLDDGSDSDNTDEDNDVPLAVVAKISAKDKKTYNEKSDDDSSESDEVPLARLKKVQNTKGIGSESGSKMNTQHDNVGDSESSMEHECLGDSDDDPDWIPTEEDNEHIEPLNVPTLETNDSVLRSQDKNCPESFLVEGQPRCLGSSPTKRKISEKESIRHEVKKKRNLGLSYVSEKSRKVYSARRRLRSPCSSSECNRRALGCALFAEEDRARILDAFFNLGDLYVQRQWIARNVNQVNLQNPTVGAKTKMFKYYLPLEDGTKMQVCKVMFLNTLGISDRQIRTTMSKIDAAGVLEKENPGGRHTIHKIRDNKVQVLVKAHINRFPKMESHYCRQKTQNQYLSPELTVTKMHELYSKEHTGDEKVSFSFYSKVFRGMGLKFHHPKKDQCGLCMSYRSGNDEEKQRLQGQYERHISEKEKVRIIKENMKKRSEMEGSFLAACFDLQQVLFLPTSDRSEIFYKRQLSCYNFTVYNLGNKERHCFFWHEGQARRGANEISSYLPVPSRK